METTRRLIFLDVDGVLNSDSWVHEMGSLNEDSLCPENMERLNRLLELTGAEVVLSATCRIGLTLEEISDLMVQNGFRGKLVGKTPSLQEKRPSGVWVAQPRWLEISSWLQQAEGFQDYDFIILDDEKAMGPLQDRLVCPSFYAGGLQEKHVQEALKLFGVLGGPDENQAHR